MSNNEKIDDRFYTTNLGLKQTLGFFIFQFSILYFLVVEEFFLTFF